MGLGALCVSLMLPVRPLWVAVSAGDLALGGWKMCLWERRGGGLQFFNFRNWLSRSSLRGHGKVMFSKSVSSLVCASTWGAVTAQAERTSLQNSGKDFRCFFEGNLPGKVLS